MGITLKRSKYQCKWWEDCKRSWSITVTATSDLEDMSGKIFVYHAAEADDPDRGDKFSNVASLQDMNIIPEDEPVTLGGAIELEEYIPFYRTDSVTMDFYTAKDMERFWEIMKTDVRNLMYDYHCARKLEEDEEVTFE